MRGFCYNMVMDNGGQRSYTEWSQLVAKLAISAVDYLRPANEAEAKTEFLANQRDSNEAPKEVPSMDEIKTKEDYEVIFAIVNNGFADLVMDAAKGAGARGGTVLNARGTGNKEMEKFFGIVITPEKQIVMILVPKTIKDQVLTAIYNMAGLATKGQGIAFAISASDVVGLSAAEPEEKEEEESAATVSQISNTEE